MRILLASLLLTGLSFQQPLPAAGTHDPSLRDLLTHSEFQKYQKDLRYKKRIDLFRKAFKSRGEMLRRSVQLSQQEAVVELLQQLRALCRHVADESSRARQQDLRSKQVKKLEISLRKLIETLEDLKSASPFEYQDEFDSTSQTLEKLRKTLLKQLFGDLLALGSAGRAGRMEGAAASRGSWSHHSAVPSAVAQSGRQRLPSGDRFTDKEYGQIQLNQELDKRVGVFLDIAASRLQEIQRRMKGEEWSKEDANPLEFYTYWDMVHAYRRALDSLMINIDEKATYKSASKREVRKSLKKLSKKIEQFIPQLEPIKRFAKDSRDKDLYREVVKAQETSVVARKGSQYGLEALDK